MLNFLTQKWEKCLTFEKNVKISAEFLKNLKENKIFYTGVIFGRFLVDYDFWPKFGVKCAIWVKRFCKIDVRNLLKMKKNALKHIFFNFDFY